MFKSIGAYPSRELVVLCLCVLAGMFTACDQRPVDVAPAGSVGEWIKVDVPGANVAYYGLSGNSPSNIYALTNDSNVIRFDGSTWSKLERGRPGSYITPDLWVDPSGGVWIACDTKFYHYDGSRWTMAYDANYPIQAIWGSSANDIFLFGNKYVFRFDGSSWETDTLATGTSVWTGWGSGPEDVYAAGYDEVIVHYDGSGWSEVHRSANASTLITGWGSGPNDVYAASPRKLLHYDGIAWATLTLPITAQYIEEIWGSAADDVFLIHHDNAILHFDGNGWTEMSSNTAMRLHSIWGTASDDVYAVGERAKIIHYDGDEWSSVSGGGPVGSDYIWALDANNVYLGNQSTIVRFDGTDYEEMPGVPGGLESAGLWGTSPSNLYSVGKNGKIFKYDGAGWARETVPTSASLHAVTGTGSGAIWTVGDDQTCLRYDGSTWNAIHEKPGGGTFTGVWAPAPSRLFVVGDEGLLTSFNGVVWTFYEGITGLDIIDVWGSAADDVYAITRSEGWHFNGTVWKKVTFPPAEYNAGLKAIAGTGPAEVFIGTYGRFYYFDGTVWSVHDLQQHNDLLDVWCGPNGLCFGMSSGYGNDVLYRYRR